ncbi:alpha-L-fucosidase [Aestuariimicrobium soli]|uniref:alpha-L-fucosidase n=1 Tax=Aestuariimicrobium soli TaxID=2035834 RepID=UPI003EB955EE
MLPTPTPQQLRWQRAGMGVFFHVGLNTFADLEWSDGTLPAASFDPTNLDADQWVRVAKAAGATYVVLTAKHHDGFCLWPTATTDYSVASSPWRGGEGDLVREVREACDRHGLGYGLYLSPWDRHDPRYPDEAAYDEVYLAQLTELLTNYGPLHEIWFDGAGSEGHTYDWPRIMAVVDELQPDAMVFNMGRPTIRWVGNEDGVAADPVHYLTTRTELSNYTDAELELGEEVYLPPECDVSLRPGWFWHPAESPRSLEELLHIHDSSLGLGAGLLLNLPPDDRGLIPDEDVARLAQWRSELRRRFEVSHEAEVVPVEGGTLLRFGGEVTVDSVWLHERLDEGQRIFEHSLHARGAEVASGGTVGVRRLHRFDPVTASEFVVRHDDGVIETASGHLSQPA